MPVKVGEIYWLKSDPSKGIRHPRVVIEAPAPGDNDNQAVLSCELTSNLKRVSIPGNVLLDPGEGNLARQSVVQVGKVAIVDQAALGEYIGTLSAARVEQIRAGRRFLQRAYLPR